MTITEILLTFPFSELKDSKSVGWNNRRIEGFGEVWMPSWDRSDTTTLMVCKSDVRAWAKQFIQRHSENPIVKIIDGKVTVANKKFKRAQEDYKLGKAKQLEAWKK